MIYYVIGAGYVASVRPLAMACHVWVPELLVQKMHPLGGTCVKLDVYNKKTLQIIAIGFSSRVTFRGLHKRALVWSIRNGSYI